MSFGRRFVATAEYFRKVRYVLAVEFPAIFDMIDGDQECRESITLYFFLTGKIERITWLEEGNRPEITFGVAFSGAAGAEVC